ncbi:hypothetical protein [Winogradskyella poriferorum]|uniref:hypothetical protein n=1 Tax=Winogradskyella poriferorum TaxID=307627 RepID=UPI003D65DAF8
MKKTLLLLFIILSSASLIAQDTKEVHDFSDVDSYKKASRLHKKGNLAKIYMMPIDFGGDDSEVNTLFVPAFVKDFKDKVDKRIETLLYDGKKLSFEALPEYKGKSFVPSKLKILVTGDVEFTEVIDIW